MQTTSSQPRAIYYVVALQIWEYFSTRHARLLISISPISSNMTITMPTPCSAPTVRWSMLTPILGGYLADKLLGNRMAVMLGALMAIGHLVLETSETAHAFPVPVAGDVVCGYGLFKSNVSCLLGELYEPADPRRDGGFSSMYAAGNHRLDYRADRLRLRAGGV